MAFREGMNGWTYVSTDGRKIPVSKMADSHLLNALRIIEKSAGTLIASGHSAKKVEHALTEVVPCYRAMVAERKRRGLENR